jgi:hypothetical protein
MSIDITTETLLSPTEAARERVFRRNGKSIHASAIYRYIVRGCTNPRGERIRLETIRTPMGVRTSREAITRFIAALSGQSLPASTSATRKKQIEQAEKELEAAGFEVGGPAAA